MKFKLTDPFGFSDVGTVVYYKERPFNDIEIKNNRAESYLYSTSLTSEYVDFGKTGFMFSGSSEDELIPNLFDYQNTLSLLGGETKFDDLTLNSFPTLSTGRSEKHFFGKLGSSCHVIHLPKDIWKVEVYNSRISENNSSEEGGGFIDHDTLVDLKMEVLESPVLTIYFGPDYDTYIQDLTLEEIESEFKTYLDRYINLTDREYKSFTNELSKREYLKLYREEIKSEKILYIINTPEGELETINFYSLAYPESKNPHPHTKEIALRNDDLWNEDLGIMESPIPGMVVDSRSGVLLGLRNLSKEECSWFHGAPHSLGNFDKVNGRVWKKAGVKEVFGENPEISPWWYCPEDLPESEFKNFYVTVKGKGKVSPSGLVWLGPDKPLILKNVSPELGYFCSGIGEALPQHILITEGGDICIDTETYKKGHVFEVVFEEITYFLNLQIDCLKDYRNDGFKTTYNLYDIGGSNYTPLSDIDVKLIYLNEFMGEEVFGVTGSSYTKSKPPKISYTEDLYFRLDFSNSLYEPSGDLRYSDGSSIDLETINGKNWYVLKASKFPNSIISGEKYIIPIGEIILRKYTIQIKASSGIQISTPTMNILEYGESFIVLIEGSNSIDIYKNDQLVENGFGKWSLEKISDGLWTFKVNSIDSDYKIIAK